MKFLTSCLAAALIATSAMAQDDLEARRAAAERYLSSPAQQKMIEAMFAPDQMMAMLRAQAPTATEEQLDGVANIIAEELAKIRTKMEKVMLETAVERFTLEELEALDEFYRSDIGESVMVKMPVFMQSYMTQMGPDMQTMQRNIGQRVRAEVLMK